MRLVTWKVPSHPRPLGHVPAGLHQVATPIVDNPAGPAYALTASRVGWEARDHDGGRVTRRAHRQRAAGLGVTRNMAPPERCHLHQKGDSTMRKPYGHSERLADARPCVGWPFTAGGLMRLTTGLALVLTVGAGLLGSCATAPASREDQAALVAAATVRLQQMRTADPELGALIQKGHGYSVFPHVDKGGLVVGGGYGRGVVYEQGQHIGYSDVKQG